MKAYLEVGFADTVETAPSVWQEVITPKKYYCEIEKRSYKYASADTVNNEPNANVGISIVGDSYAFNHLSNLRYVLYQNVKRRITSATPSPPRIDIEFNGVYNE